MIHGLSSPFELSSDACCAHPICGCDKSNHEAGCEFSEPPCIGNGLALRKPSWSSDIVFSGTHSQPNEDEVVAEHVTHGQSIVLSRESGKVLTVSY